MNEQTFHLGSLTLLRVILLRGVLGVRGGFGRVNLIRYKTIIVLALILSTHGCANHLVRIKDQNATFEGTGYLIKPPGGGEWFYNRMKNIRGNITYLFGRKNQSETLSN